MPGKLRATMEYLGFAEADQQYADDHYEDYAQDPQGRAGAGADHDDYGYDDYRDSGYADEEPAAVPAPVTPLHRPAAAVAVRHDLEGAMSRITTIHPRTYNEAKDIGESFRSGVPVIMNLSDMDDNDAKRLVDFAAGLIFGLHGSIERVTSKVFLLSPAGVEVSTSGTESGRPTRGIFNQS